MVNLNLVSKNFSHAPSSTWYKKSDFITWEYDTNRNPITFYLDGDMFRGFNEQNDGKKKVLWGLESPAYNGDFFNQVKNNLQQVLDTYDLILTYDDELIKLNDKFVFCPANGFWVEDSQLFTKDKVVSMICSDKQSTQLQKFRVNFANENKHKIEVYGHLCRGIQRKEDGLRDFMFSVCVENVEHDTYFTEKILDCFATGTIPVYKGTKKIVNHFNREGILFLDDINIEELNESLYLSKIEAVKENFEIVQKYNVLENWIYKTYLENKLL